MWGIFTFLFTLFLMIAIMKHRQKRKIKKRTDLIIEREREKIRPDYEKIRNNQKLLTEILKRDDLSAEELKQTEELFKKNARVIEKCIRLYGFEY